MDKEVKAFADHMQYKLNKNKHKECLVMNKDKRGRRWDKCSIDWLMFRLRQEVMELEKTYENKNTSKKDMQNEAADVGNFAMMIFDNFED